MSGWLAGYRGQQTDIQQAEGPAATLQQHGDERQETGEIKVHNYKWWFSD